MFIFIPRFDSLSANSNVMESGLSAIKFNRGPALMDAVIYIISDETGIDMELITPDSGFFEDLGLDELDLYEIIMRCEEEFGVTISNENASKIITVQDLHDVIHPLLYEP